VARSPRSVLLRHNGARRGRLDAVGDRLCESE
jgi:hypothetical protein